ncbi:MAG: Asp-tRNA(Asn)/Glu-tRNA(Gln) amidotransferase subunit GatB [Chloroflexota bacterium]|nr:MAG: Asp-tRNA(Asn)/Glu-tRNA(Gln) amidotransferase subunit GatB [Chloroflexota bacterium]
MTFESVIGLEVHAELETKSKMFCSCPVVDSTVSDPNIAVCPVCTGMPGVLPVVNQRAVEYALRVALALECEIAETSIFARKNYFYPDLPKGYQISQYEQPLARNGRLKFHSDNGEREIRIRRVHLEEDTGKLTHVHRDEETFSLVDLNRAGVPLLEIVSEPDLRSAAEVRAFATSLRSILRYLKVNSGDLEKGVIRVEPNISVRPAGSNELGTRVEVKNLNSFRALERSVDFEIKRQINELQSGRQVIQQTVGWDESLGMTIPQRTKEEEDDYRYFPEPDLPPLVLDPEWIEGIRNALPELPDAKLHRFTQQYSLSEYDAGVLVAERSVADYYEDTVASLAGMPQVEVSPKTVANWITGELFGLLNLHGVTIEQAALTPQGLASLLQLVSQGEINQNTAKVVLGEMFASGKPADEIIAERGFTQISDSDFITKLVDQVLSANPQQVDEYIHGKDSIARWLFGQVMRLAKGQANPQVVQTELDKTLTALRQGEDH